MPRQSPSTSPRGPTMERSNRQNIISTLLQASVLFLPFGWLLFMSFAVVFVLHVHRACLTASDIFLFKNFGPACNGAAGHFWHHVLQPESFVLGCNLLLSNVLPSVKCRHRSIPCTNESAQPATSTIPYHCFFSAIGFHPRPRHVQQNYNIQSCFFF